MKANKRTREGMKIYGVPTGTERNLPRIKREPDSKKVKKPEQSEDCIG